MARCGRALTEAAPRLEIGFSRGFILPPRPLLHFDIDARQGELRDFVAPDDFVLRRRDTPVPFPHGALAYCADLQAERVLFTCHAPATLPALFQAPFLYAAQLQAAEHIVAVPYERLADIEPEDAPPAPVLVFSLGRTGSTLLARLLHAASVPCASEPDMLAQICRFGREDRLRMGLPMEPALMRACLVALTGALAGDLPLVRPPFVKLRSHCNARPLPLMEAVPGARAIFMLRRAAPWARSRHRAFGETPASIAAVLREAADALDKLSGCAAPMQVLWFEDLAADPAATLRECLGPGFVDEAALARVMARDSQDGTAMARDALSGGTIGHDFDDRFLAAWHQARAGAQWSPATEKHLRHMFE
jgi:hypothetical protein